MTEQNFVKWLIKVKYFYTPHVTFNKTLRVSETYGGSEAGGPVQSTALLMYLTLFSDINKIWSVF